MRDATTMCINRGQADNCTAFPMTPPSDSAVRRQYRAYRILNYKPHAKAMAAQGQAHWSSPRTWALERNLSLYFEKPPKEREMQALFIYIRKELSMPPYDQTKWRFTFYLNLDYLNIISFNVVMEV